MHYKWERGTWDWRPGDSIKHDLQEKDQRSMELEIGRFNLAFQRERGTWNWRPGDSIKHDLQEKDQRSMELETGGFNLALLTGERSVE